MLGCAYRQPVGSSMKITNARSSGSSSQLKLLAWALAATVSLTACGDKKDRDKGPPAVTEAGPSVVISGTLSFEFVPTRELCFGLNYAATELRPIRGATVQLVEVEGGRVLDSTAATADGSYALHSAPGGRVFVRVRAELQSRDGSIQDVEVRDNTAAVHRPLVERPLYVLDGSPFVVEEAGMERHLIARSGWDGTAYSGARAAAPFAILDSVYRAMALVRQADPQAEFPALDVFWSPDNSTAASSAGFDERIGKGQIGTSFYSPAHSAIFLLGRADQDTEEFDSHVIIHEWAHYFEQAFSRSDSPGGAHSLDEALDKRLAFSEGMATALSGMVLESSFYCDTSGPGQGNGFRIDLDNRSPRRPGWFNEMSVLSLMYALWSPGQPERGFEFGELYQVLTLDQRVTPAFTSIFSFAAALKERFPERRLLVEQLLTRYDINGSDAYGSNEVNTGGGRHGDALPIYSSLPDDGSTVEICVNDEFDVARNGNKLSQFRYLHLRVEREGLYELSVNTRNPPTATGSSCPGAGLQNHHSDPDFRLLKNGRIVLEEISCGANEQKVEAVLSPGEYAMAISEKRFVDAATASDFRNRICFAVTARPLF